MQRVIDYLEQGAREGLHLGGQLHVRRANLALVDFAFGEARPGIPMRPDSVVQWYSAGKPLTAVALAQLHERGALDIESPVSRVIPEFAQHGKESLTFKHLLAHTAGLRTADKLPPGTPWPEMIAEICATALEPGWVPGEQAGYSTQASWFILAEAIQRLVNRPFDEHLKSALLDPLAMSDSWLRLPFAKFRDYRDRLALMFDTARGSCEPLPMQDAQGMSICRPGASARGPVRELANFYSMLLTGGLFERTRLLREQTIHWMTTPHRAGLYDRTFLHTLDFGLGFLLDSNRYGRETVPYGYGLHSSGQTFGHSGAQSSCAFADPRHNLVVAWVLNGQPGERQHQTRQRAINTLIYEELGIP